MIVDIFFKDQFYNYMVDVLAIYQRFFLNKNILVFFILFKDSIVTLI